MISRKLILALMRQQFEVAGFPEQQAPLPWKERVVLGAWQKEFEAVLDMCCTVRVLKLEQYGTAHLDPANWNAPMQGISSHMHDLHRKWARISNMMWDRSAGVHGANLFDPEAAQDRVAILVESLLDLVNYAAQFIQVLWRLDMQYGIIGVAEETGDRGDIVGVDTAIASGDEIFIVATSVDPSTFIDRVECGHCRRDFSFAVRKDDDGTFLDFRCPHCGKMFQRSSTDTWPVGLRHVPQEGRDWIADAVECSECFGHYDGQSCPHCGSEMVNEPEV